MKTNPTALGFATLIAFSLACNLTTAIQDLPTQTAVETLRIPSSSTTQPLPTMVEETTESPPDFTPTSTLEPLEDFDCWEAERAVAVIIQSALLEGLYENLRLFLYDLCADGYAVILRTSDFATPPELRAYLSDLYQSGQQPLKGAILIGDLPHAYQWVTLTSSNPDIPPTAEEAMSFQYYADLNGVFEASAGYVSPGGHVYSFDMHSGEFDWEIWIGVLPLYKGDAEATIEALNRYFERNHAYRSGEFILPRGFIQVNEHFKANTVEGHDQYLSGLRDGQYSWTPFSNATNARIYFDSTARDLSVDQGYEDLSNGVADFFVTDAHGYWGASGKLDIAWVENHPLQTAFFWSNGCSVGNLDYDENFLSAALYSPTSMVLIAKGTTNNSGGMGTNSDGFFGHNIAASLIRGDSFGQSILNHVNVTLVDPWSRSREFHYGTSVILGDLTLKLREQSP